LELIPPAHLTRSYTFITMASSSLLAATHQSRNAVLSRFKEHTGGVRIDTNTKVLNMLRDEYTEYHVTEVSAKEAALFEFAAAGKAALVLDADDETFQAKRSWLAVGDGVDKKMHPGKLTDGYRFARYVEQCVDPGFC
jgi:transitional endoplasmic reticulum ATPase